MLDNKPLLIENSVLKSVKKVCVQKWLGYVSTYFEYCTYFYLINAIVQVNNTRQSEVYMYLKLTSRQKKIPFWTERGVWFTSQLYNVVSWNVNILKINIYMYCLILSFCVVSVKVTQYDLTSKFQGLSDNNVFTSTLFCWGVWKLIFRICNFNFNNIEQTIRPKLSQSVSP